MTYAYYSPKKQDDNIWELLVATIVGIILEVIADGLVVAHMWQWFVADTFGITRISVAVAAGISLLGETFIVPVLQQEVPKSGVPSYIWKRIMNHLVMVGFIFLLGLVLVRYR